jgi:hypothetical protein
MSQPYVRASAQLTSEVLDRIAEEATRAHYPEIGERFKLAKANKNALQEAAVLLEEQWSEPLSEDTKAGLAQGVAGLVRGLKAAGFHTCDSGDGTNYGEGMECALPYRHVFISLAPWQDLEAEAERVRRFLAWMECDDEFEVTTTDLDDGPPYAIAVMDKRAEEIMAEVGYEPPPFFDVHEASP